MAEAFFEQIQNGYGYSDYNDPISVYLSNNQQIKNTVTSITTSKIFALNNYRSFYSFSNLKYVNFTNLKVILSDISFNNVERALFPKLKVLGSAFYFNSYLTYISIPKLELLGHDAFYYCASLSSININNCKIIGASAFYNCRNLKEIYSEEVEAIGCTAISNAQYLTKIDFPNLKYIDLYDNNYHTHPSYLEIIGHCPLLSYVNFGKVNKLTTKYRSYSSKWSYGFGLMYNCPKLEIVSMPELEVIESVSYLFDTDAYSYVNFSFYAPKLKKIKDTSGLLYGRNFNKIDFPNLKIIDNCSFLFYKYSSGMSDVTEINLPELEYLTGSTIFYLYQNYHGTTTLNINIPKLKYISGYHIFDYCRFPNDEFIGNNISYMSGHSIFGYGYYGGLKYITLPKISFIASSLFCDLYTLSYINITNCEYIDNFAFDGCHRLMGTYTTNSYNSLLSISNIQTVFYLSKCSKIGYRAFNYCQALRAIKFPEVLTINSSAFAGCNNLKYVDFGKCNQIGAYAFSRCSNIANITFPEVKNVGRSVFDRCRYLGYAWRQCDNNGAPNLSEYSYGTIVQVGFSYIDWNYSSSSYLNFGYGAAYYSSDNKWYYNDSELRPIEFSSHINDWLDSSITWPFILPKCETFNDGFGTGVKYISKIYLPECLSFFISAGSYNSSTSTFSDYFPYLEELNIPKASFISIFNLKNLKTLRADGITVLSNFKYYGTNISTITYNLEKLYLNNVTEIGNIQYDSIMYNRFPSSLKELYMENYSGSGYGLFSFNSYTPYIETLYMPKYDYGNDGKYISLHFWGCSFLKKVNLDALTYISNYMFNGCISLSRLSLPSLSSIDCTVMSEINSTLFPSELKTLNLFGSNVLSIYGNFKSSYWFSKTYALSFFRNIFGTSNPSIQIAVPRSLYDAYCARPEWAALNNWTDGNIITARI